MQNIKFESGQMLFCPLYEHQKHTDVCTVLRAKRVCNRDCKQYWDWAAKHKEVVGRLLIKHDKVIAAHLKITGKQAGNILSRGDHICDYCEKAFKKENGLKKHKKKNHRREMVLREERGRRPSQVYHSR